MAVMWLMMILALTSAVMADVEPRPQTPETPAPTAAISEVLARIEARMTSMDSKVTVGLQTLQRDVYGMENKLGYLVTLIQMMKTKMVLPEKIEALESKVEDLSEELKAVHRISDENLTQLEEKEKPVDAQLVVCPASVPDKEILFLNRKDGSVDFYRNWTVYKDGFGNRNGEFWLGLDCLNNITNTRQYGLRVEFGDWAGHNYQSRFSHISVGGEADGYRLSVSGYDESSNGGDSLTYHNNDMFTTYDRDNDRSSDNCAVLDRGGWWYGDCHFTNPTGLYLTGGQNDMTGITWYDAKIDRYSYKSMNFTLIP